MKYITTVYFTDLQDGRHAYYPGDEFPRKSLKVSAARLKELSTTNNRRGRAVIEEVKEPDAEPKQEEQKEPKPKRERKKKNAD